ncbi:Sialidase precursor [Anatilimnocola aggregata]|uniref:exo-alpha-sialidase n=1 Tax=Anatilimnocola aggregata TaxID=2528021 RepID=A0A517YHW3_9BACT|nr:sialidase family protein [Anatilimnocola aggregata]QDU29801.1 Sialidase precursor [Anatilimnocola aggregata]
MNPFAAPVVSLFVLTATALSAFAQVPESTAHLPTEPLFVSGEGGYGRYRIPALIATKQGTLLAFCEGRVKATGLIGDIDLVLRRSTDGGKTWLPMQKIADASEDTLGNPCPVVDQKTGTIWLPFTRSPGPFSEQQIVDSQSSGPTTVWIIKSDDEGATWSEPRDISATTREPSWTWYGTGPGIGIQLASGRLFIPSYHTERDSKMYRCHAIFSDDGGRTWQKGETVGEHTAECQAAQRSDGTVVLNMRGTNKQGFRTLATSRDAGETWSKPEIDRTLTEPACQAALIVMNEPVTDRRLWLFSNPPGTTRHNLTLRASKDEGKTWPVAKVFDPGATEYSSLVSLPGGNLGLLYELSRKGEKYRPQLHFANIPLTWIQAP